RTSPPSRAGPVKADRSLVKRERTFHLLSTRAQSPVDMCAPPLIASAASGSSGAGGTSSVCPSAPGPREVSDDSGSPTSPKALRRRRARRPDLLGGRSEPRAPGGGGPAPRGRPAGGHRRRPAEP